MHGEYEAMTERVTALLTPTINAELKTIREETGVTMGEQMRRALRGFIGDYQDDKLRQEIMDAQRARHARRVAESEENGTPLKTFRHFLEKAMLTHSDFDDALRKATADMMAYETDLLILGPDFEESQAAADEMNELEEDFIRDLAEFYKEEDLD